MSVGTDWGTDWWTDWVTARGTIWEYSTVSGGAGGGGTWAGARSICRAAQSSSGFCRGWRRGTKDIRIMTAIFAAMHLTCVVTCSRASQVQQSYSCWTHDAGLQFPLKF